jgi:ferredoxin-NADP reductase/ferredoxin
MAKVIYGGQSYECGDNSVLDCLTAQGVPVPSSCRTGACQTCMMRAIEGVVPEKARAGLKPTLAAQNYFLACSCYPETDLVVTLPDTGPCKLDARVTGIEYLNSDILGIRLKPLQAIEYKAGQFINLFKDEATARCYSLASVPALEDELFLNVRKVPGGLVSNWIFDTVKLDDVISISDASGDCFYVPGNPDQNILLIATGSGLAPLYGIIRDALSNGHQGKIILYHGSYNTDGFYLVEALQKLAENHPNFSYVACISDGPAAPGYASGMVLDVALADNPNLSGWRVFLCGNPNMVNAAKQQTFFAGASMRDIFADPF